MWRLMLRKMCKLSRSNRLRPIWSYGYYVPTCLEGVRRSI